MSALPLDILSFDACRACLLQSGTCKSGFTSCSEQKESQTGNSCRTFSGSWLIFLVLTILGTQIYKEAAILKTASILFGRNLGVVKGFQEYKNTSGIQSCPQHSLLLKAHAKTLHPLFLSGTVTLEMHPKDQPEYLSLSSHRWNSFMAWKQAAWWRMARGGTGMLMSDKRLS